MAQRRNNLWNRHKYKINGLALTLPFYFLYQSLNPKFPQALNTQQIGSFVIAPTPFNLEPPYLHDGHYTKDFMLTFSQGNIKDIRQAYLNIGSKALPFTKLQAGDDGILHGNQHSQEVHAIAPAVIKSEHKLWLTIENWQGNQFVTSWGLPKTFFKQD